ncbi:hypothetical protein LR48_Vigan10g098800 [Vigna angularis]|nr:hypothetical protein LR48_Vigan10g098800 [Vigna angularis]
MQKREELSCLIDYWMQETLREIEEAKLTGEPAAPFSVDSEIGVGDAGAAYRSREVRADGVAHDTKGDDRVPVSVRVGVSGVQ